MPNVTYTNWNKTIRTGPLADLRTIAKLAGISLYNGLAKFANCHGAGLCGTCTVYVEPQAGLTPPTGLEKLHGCTGPFRLACQARVAHHRHDLLVTKHEGHRGKGRMPIKVDGVDQVAPAVAAVPAAAPAQT
jgi:ferredoxin